jgi:aminoglycoside phosphotransferase (APT) family kinase protein
MRIGVEIDGRLRSLIVKRFPPDRARRERDAIERWLPALGLEAQGPPLLATAADRRGRFQWFAYEDLGDCTLAERNGDPRATDAAVRLVAELHARSAEQPLLAEVRSLGADLGIAFTAASVRDAMRALRALAATRSLTAAQRALCARLLERIDRLGAQQRARAELLAECGGPETLQHGDLWTINVLVRSADTGLEARLIDWDHAGVGPVSYDLSAFLMGFPLDAREALLARYRECYEQISDTTPCWPSRSEWNALFDGAERARLANAVVWRTLGALAGHVAWALDELAWHDAAFAALGPVLPDASQAPAESRDAQVAPREPAPALLEAP